MLFRMFFHDYSSALVTDQFIYGYKKLIQANPVHFDQSQLEFSQQEIKIQKYNFNPKSYYEFSTENAT